MKVRKFYPSQVLRRLSGKRLSALDAANRCALGIGMLRSRKSGVAITVVDDQIDVRNAADLGRMMLGDLKAMVKQNFAVGSVALPVLAQDELEVAVPRLMDQARDLGITVTPSQLGN